MSKVTKRELQRDIKILESGIGMNWTDMKKIETRLNREIIGMAQQLEALEEFATYADNLITKLNHALPSDKPQLKQLDQSVFNGLDEKWRFVGVSSVGSLFAYIYRPTGRSFILSGDTSRRMANGEVMALNLYGYDASDWQNSLIEREKVELTGSDLCRAMLENASKPIMCAVSDISTSKAMSLGNYDLIHDYTDQHGFMSLNQTWIYAVPINNQGEPLTAKEAGL